MTIGIYSITHINSGKKYIGKSVNIERRIIAHKCSNSKTVRSKVHTNRYLYNAVQKYGWTAFTVEILETFDAVDEKTIAERELHWIDFFKSTSREFGFNLRRDSSSGMIVHPETRKLYQGKTGDLNPNYGNKWTPEMREKMSIIAKARHASGEIYGNDWRKKQGIKSAEFWANNPVIKQEMIEKVTLANTKYKISQYTKQGQFVTKWESVGSIVSANPSYKKHNIYAACSGEKPSMYGFVWKKEIVREQD